MYGRFKRATVNKYHNVQPDQRLQILVKLCAKPPLVGRLNTFI